MSTRYMRKLYGSDLISLKNNDGKDDNSDSEESINVGLKPKSYNVFDLLEENTEKEEEEEEDDACSQEETKDEVSSQDSSVKNRKKKRKNKKNSKQKKAEKPAVSGEEEEDEIDKTIRQINQLLGEPEPSTSKNGNDNSNRHMQTPKMNSLLVQHKHLNPYNEQKRIFGSKTVQAELKGRRRSKGRPNLLKKIWLVSVRDNWLPVAKSGFSMVIDKSIQVKDGTQFFVYQHDASYQALQKKFIHAVQSLDPENIIALLNENHYHIDSLLQVSEICKMNEELPIAAALLERALFNLEYAFHPMFNITNGNCRMDYRRQENRALFVTLFKHLMFVSGRGCYRTSLELCKLLLSLDPEGDPLAAVLAIDFYAIRSQEYVWFLEFFDCWEQERNLSQLPNIAFGLALAHFHLGDQEKASELIQNALIMFPGVLLPLMDKCGISMDTKVLAHNFFTRKAEVTTPPALEKLEKLYIVRSFHLWREPEIWSWLEVQVNLVLKRVDDCDEYIDYCKKKRYKRYMAKLPRNIMRHIFLSDLKDVTISTQTNSNERPTLSHDPFPPLDSIDIYTVSREPQRRRVAEGHSIIVSLFSSLFDTQIGDAAHADRADRINPEDLE